MFIESNSLWILFIDRYFLNSVFFDALLHQLSSRSFSSFFRCKKEHFQTGILRSHKSNWCPGFILSYDQVFHSL